MEDDSRNLVKKSKRRNKNPLSQLKKEWQLLWHGFTGKRKGTMDSQVTGTSFKEEHNFFSSLLQLQAYKKHLSETRKGLHDQLDLLNRKLEEGDLTEVEVRVYTEKGLQISQEIQRVSDRMRWAQEQEKSFAPHATSTPAQA